MILLSLNINVSFCHEGGGGELCKFDLDTLIQKMHISHDFKDCTDLSDYKSFTEIIFLSEIFMQLNNQTRTARLKKSLIIKFLIFLMKVSWIVWIRTIM